MKVVHWLCAVAFDAGGSGPAPMDPGSASASSAVSDPVEGPQVPPTAGDIEVEEARVDTLLVTVLGSVTTRAAVEDLLSGWAEHMGEPDGVHWVADRLQAAGITRPTLD